jgi:hypothetical protein
MLSVGSVSDLNNLIGVVMHVGFAQSIASSRKKIVVAPLGREQDAV